MRSVLPTAALLAAALLLAAPLAAQHPTGNPDLREVHYSRHRDGFWASLGLGVGQDAFRYNGDPAYSENINAATLSVSLGGTPSRNLLLGGELFAWFRDQSGAIESLSSAMLIGQWYPFGSADLFLKGGFGLTNYALDPDFGATYNQSGYGGVLGAGYDLRVGRNVSLTPTIDFYGHRYSDRHERIMNLGVAVTFH